MYSLARTWASRPAWRVSCTGAQGPARVVKRSAHSARVSLERLLDRTSDISISERKHGPADARRYRYLPTYILRGLTQLYLEFDR
jgi:hypothetical protein